MATKAKKKKAPAKRKAPAKARAQPSGKKAGPSKKERIEALAKVFHALGAKTPTSWATTHVEKGSDELGRFMLLRALWLRLVEPGRLLGTARSDHHIGSVVDRMLKTVSISDLDAIIRYAQRTAVNDVCKVLDDPGNEGIRWGVFRVDPYGMPLWPLRDLRSGLADSEP